MLKINLILYQKFLICAIFTFVFIFTQKHGKTFYLRDLTVANFNATLQENDFVLVVYYTTGCGPCEKFLPDFEYAGGKAIKKDPPILFAKVNCAKSSSNQLCYDITEIPVMKFYKWGRYVEDFSFNERQHMADHAAKFVKPDIEEILSKNHYIQYLSSTSYAVIGMFAKPSKLKEAYFNVTNLMYGRFDYAQTSEEEVLNYQKVRQGVVVYKPDYMRNEFEEDFSVYNAEADLDKLRDFIIKNFNGLVGFRRPNNKDDFHPPLLTVFYDFHFKTNLEKSRKIRNILLGVANQYRNHLNFAMSITDHWEGLLQKFGFEDLEDGYEKPITTIMDIYERKYVMDEEYSAENLDNFIKKYIDKSLQPFVRSGPIPPYNETSLIYEVVARNLEEVAFSNATDTVLYIYNPTCSVSQAMTKVINNLAAELEDEGIQFCQIDGVINDLPKLVKPVGYPTIFYLQKNKKHKPIMFHGGPNFHDLIVFITRYCTENLKKFDMEGNRKFVKDEF